MSGTGRRRANERGFSLTELIIVVAIIGVLAAVAVIGTRRAQVTGRVRATTTAAATAATALSNFNRQYPRIGASDPLLTRGGTAAFASGQPEASGLYSQGGERLLDPWPTNPYTNAPVTITRHGVGACPTTGTPGAIAVCRTTGSGLRVRAWARNANGAAYLVHDQELR